jgi:insulysin
MNSGIIYNVQIGSPTDAELRAQLQLLSQIAKEPTFNQLRTQEQLGYIVMSGMTEQAGSPDYVETRIEAFMDWLKEHLETLSEEDFEKQKASLIAKKEEKPKNLGEETQRFLGRITDKYYEFDRRESVLSACCVYTDGQVKRRSLRFDRQRKKTFSTYS